MLSAGSDLNDVIRRGIITAVPSRDSRVRHKGEDVSEEDVLQKENGEGSAAPENIFDPQIAELAREILQANPELMVPGDKADQEFADILIERIKASGLSCCALDEWRRGSLMLCNIWCARHGIIASGDPCLYAYKRMLDHEQSLPGPHPIRITREDP